VYAEQLKYVQEPNWANDVKAVRKIYNITQNDNEIAAMTKSVWKRIVKKSVEQRALENLNKDLALLKVSSHLCPYNKLEQQEYMQHLLPEEVRIIFQVRAGVVDFKAVRKYWYEETVCRLCGDGEEDAEHVVNRCSKINRDHNIDNLYSNDVAVMKQVATRCLEFISKLDEEL
jgi:hypothetical protein